MISSSANFNILASLLSSYYFLLIIMYMAYASLVSLAQTLDEIFCHSRNHLLYNKQQMESLGEKVGFLQEFVEDCDQRGIEVTPDLENQMKNLGQRAEDVIETKRVDDILGNSPHPPILFCQKIEEIIQEFDSIKKMVMRMEGVKDDQCSRKTSGTSSSGLPPGGKISGMVGFKQHLIGVMDELTGHQHKRQILTIVGMGGIGKTTLCRNVYENPLIVQHFHVSAWITVSQEYNVREIIIRLLREISAPFGRGNQETTQSFEEMRDDQLGEQLYKSLCGRKYLIVMDDVWSFRVWDEVKMFLPDNGNGSRIMVTTRQSDVAHRLSSCTPYNMDFLDENESWSLLCQIVFGQLSYPVEFEDIGKQIARNCKGLPLAIVVIGGLLSKSDRTTEYWEYVAQHLSSIVNSENDEHCLNVLSLSYKQLPVHLKPCFLYMGIFPEDDEIRVSKLIRLWVAEGFLKPIVAKSLEEVAEEYLKDLVDRNLILVETRKSNGKMRSCKVHDLLRDLCIKEAHKDNFFWLVTGGMNSLGNQRDLEEAPQYIRESKFFKKISSRISNCFGLKHGDRHPSPPHLGFSSTPAPSCMKDTRRLVIPEHRFDKMSQIYEIAKSASFTRSLFADDEDLILCFRLLRIVDYLHTYLHTSRIMKVVNCRYLAFRIQPSYLNEIISIPPTIVKLRNLQTLVVSSYMSAGPIALPSEIWKMPHLRHIVIKEEAILSELETLFAVNLQTLSTICNLCCDDENFLQRISNLKKLKISVRRNDHYHLNNLVHLQKLESLSCRGFGKISLGNQAFPDSIKELTFSWLKLEWEDMSLIGCLPNLQLLQLRGAAYGEEWNTTEGGFLKLKYFVLEGLNLCHWEAESSHFPTLESLILRFCKELEEIPFGIGEIPTLKLIELDHCGEEANSSAIQIQEEQRSLGNEDLQVRVKLSTKAGIIYQNPSS